MSSPIQRYLNELENALPVPSPRTVAEVRAHLLESKQQAVAAGVNPDEAEARAVAAIGPVEDLVAAVKKEGTPHLSPRVVRWVPPLAALLILPTLIFVAVNAIEAAAGNSGGVGVFGGTLDRWQAEINGLLTVGPLAALALLLLSRSNMRVGLVSRGIEFSVQMRFAGWVLVLAVVTVLIALGVVVYLLNGPICISKDWMLKTFCS